MLIIYLLEILIIESNLSNKIDLLDKKQSFVFISNNILRIYNNKWNLLDESLIFIKFLVFVPQNYNKKN